MQAIAYFQRALKLNPDCLDAWCLIGHEFLEVKNHHCAIEAYRRAVDTDPRDVRSWYSLGQAYEMMQMPYYALFYYRKAAQLTPDDARMWVRIFCSTVWIAGRSSYTWPLATSRCAGRCSSNVSFGPPRSTIAPGCEM